MRLAFSKLQSFYKRQCFVLLTCAAWTCSIIIGILLSSCMPQSYYQLLELGSKGTTSIVGLLLSIAVPMGCIILAGKMQNKYLLYLILIVKVTSATVCSASLSVIYGSAAWLVRFFFQFSDLLTLPVLCWISIVFSVKSISRSAIIGIAAWLMIVCSADYLIISPFFAGLIGN